MASVSTLSFLKSRLYAKSRLFNEIFNFGHKISFLKSRLYVKSRFVKSRLYCIMLLTPHVQLQISELKIFYTTPYLHDKTDDIYPSIG